MNLTKHRILQGTLFHEINTFASDREVLGDFSISIGDELLPAGAMAPRSVAKASPSTLVP